RGIGHSAIDKAGLQDARTMHSIACLKGCDGAGSQRPITDDQVGGRSYVVPPDLRGGHSFPPRKLLATGDTQHDPGNTISSAIMGFFTERRLSVRVGCILLALAALLSPTHAYTELPDDALRGIPSGGDGFDIKSGSLLAPILIPRVPGTPGSFKAQEHFVSFFKTKLPEWRIEWHNSTAKTPATGDKDIPFTNLIFVRDPPWAKVGDVGRLTLVAHYDSLYKPDGFIGAIDSAAPCAMLMQTAHGIEEALAKKWKAMQDSGDAGMGLEEEVGVQILLLDGEEAWVRWTAEDSLYVLESQVNSLQTRLDQMTQKMGVNDVENNTLSLERDRALKKLQQACENIGELMDKLDAREKELNETQKKLDETLQLQTTQNVAPSSGETQKHQVDALQLENKSLRAENSTLRRDQQALQDELQTTQNVAPSSGETQKHEVDALQLENKSLRADNSTLRRDQQALQDEVESLRADNNSLRREQESLVAENRSLRTNARSLMSENEEFRDNANTAQQELNAAREEVDALQQDMDAVDQEKITLKEDNDSLVRHNEKYFEENKMLRRENSGFERSIHDLHDENVRLKEEIEFLKQQLDHCRPLGKGDNFSARLGHDDEEEDGDEENMTSAFFVPDITIDENSIVDATTESNKAPPDMPTQSQRPFEIPEIDGPTEGSLADPENTFDTRAMKSRKDATQQKDMTTQGQKVAFSLPENAQNSKTTAQGANRSSKRRTAAQRSDAKGGLVADADAYMTQESTQDLTQNLSITFEPKAKSRKETTTRSEHTREHAVTMTQNMTGQSQKVTSAKSSLKPSHNKSTTVDMTSRSRKEERPSETRANCPALSANARRVLDDLCEHKCKNCVVCSRITGHRGTVSLKEATEGKKRIHVPKPIPATEQVQQLEGYTEEPTMRPSQHPGQALAMVIKGLKDEAEHLKMEFSRLQARYNDLNSALGRTARKDLASRMREMLKRLEVKNDQIYALYDVLEGQKQADQAMPEEELEMTIFSITGLSLREASQNFTLDSVAI
ncbi:hypothetical protein BN1723_009220, partial [Verticillium longisporum]